LEIPMDTCMLTWRISSTVVPVISLSRTAM
jgi:hypothetical protein